METQWVILILGGIIVLLAMSRSERGKKIKELEARISFVQGRIEALRREVYVSEPGDLQQNSFQQNASSLGYGEHLPEMRMTPKTQRNEGGTLEQLAGAGFLLLLAGAAILILTGAQ